MSTKIIGIIRPFEREQQFYVYENGNKIDFAVTTIEDMNKALLTLADKHNIEQVDLTGPKQYIKGLIKKIEQEEVTKYSFNKLKFNII